LDCFRLPGPYLFFKYGPPWTASVSWDHIYFLNMVRPGLLPSPGVVQAQNLV
jgi:hypothetical protein